MEQELQALESAISTLWLLFQDIQFDNEQQAAAFAKRLSRATKRLRDLTDLCRPEI